MDQFKQFGNPYIQQRKTDQIVDFRHFDGYEKMPDGSAKMRTFNTPPQSTFDTEEMIGSIQYILAKNIGNFVVIEFLIGTERLMRKQGLLYFVGTSFVTLYDDQLNNFLVCDIFSIKFVYFFFPGDRPHGNYNLLQNPSSSMNPKNNHSGY